MRWFYVPNEHKGGLQVGPREAFERLLKNGVFSAYEAYSFLIRKEELGNMQAAMQDWLEAARAFAPDVIFMQHVNDAYPLNSAFLQALRDLPSKPKLVFFEADPYGHLIKRFDETLKTVFAASDMVFLVGTGYLAQDVMKLGCKRVRFAPHSYDCARFGRPWQPTLTRRYDAVMIANLPRIKGISWLHVPGGHKRKMSARALYRALGDRFVVYGAQGWEGEPFCPGPIAFSRQEEVIRDSWMSVNWGQYDSIPMYASDRLPISLACGVPHITNYQRGYEHVFNNIPGLFVVKSPEELVDAALYIMSIPPQERNDLGSKAADYAYANLRSEIVYERIVVVISEQLLVKPLGA